MPISKNAIPISTAKDIAERWGYDQIIIIARKTGDLGNEAVTTYGINNKHCAVAARIGEFLKYKIMNWKQS